ncbi:hypothetical protein AVEN_26762-1 [Araneus ventricosus]|uniref:Uncharacterized protein n=1 Tax=Araneus ventricosus TaxID=182803 RepID=A0A4Y2D547_ARAVE|nr:hypothetical protein AVEN_26762-1 [Araneus ventricosus]
MTKKNEILCKWPGPDYRIGNIGDCLRPTWAPGLTRFAVFSEQSKATNTRVIRRSRSRAENVGGVHTGRGESLRRSALHSVFVGHSVACC